MLSREVLGSYGEAGTRLASCKLLSPRYKLSEAQLNDKMDLSQTPAATEFFYGHRSQTKDAFDLVHLHREHQQLEIPAGEVSGGNTLCGSADSEGDSRVKGLISDRKRGKTRTQLLIIHPDR